MLKLKQAWWIGCGTLVYHAGTVFAQINAEGVMDNNIDGIDAGRPWAEYGLAGLFVILVLALGVKGSKRSEDKGPAKA